MLLPYLWALGTAWIWMPLVAARVRIPPVPVPPVPRRERAGEAGR